jgi:hypothetical protein
VKEAAWAGLAANARHTATSAAIAKWLHSIAICGHGLTFWLTRERLILAGDRPYRRSPEAPLP